MRAVVLTALAGLLAVVVVASPKPASALPAAAALNYSHTNADLIEVRRYKRRYYRGRPYSRSYRYRRPYYGRPYYGRRYYGRPYYGRRYYGRPYRYRRPGVRVYIGI